MLSAFNFLQISLPSAPFNEISRSIKSRLNDLTDDVTSFQFEIAVTTNSLVSRMSFTASSISGSSSTTLNELEKLNADNDTFMYAVSHDIKQPLSTIVLSADLLEHARNNTEQFTKGIETLKRAATNMKIMLDDFTEHLKSETGPSIQNERLNIENICQDVILALRDRIYNKGVTINTQFKTSEILFSRKNLRSIVYNLLNNAIKYKRPEKPIKILIKTQKIKDYVLLSIQDDGVGIDKKDHKMIFKKFSRINSKTKIEGTGMGLYIVSRMMKNSHGKIELESTPGKGSTFKVYFKNKS